MIIQCEKVLVNSYAFGMAPGRHLIFMGIPGNYLIVKSVRPKEVIPRDGHSGRAARSGSGPARFFGLRSRDRAGNSESLGLISGSG